MALIQMMHYTLVTNYALNGRHDRGPSMTQLTLRPVHLHQPGHVLHSGPHLREHANHV